MAKPDSIFDAADEPVAAPQEAPEEAPEQPTAGGTPESDDVVAEAPPVKVALDPDFEVPVVDDDGNRSSEHPSEVAVAVPGTSPGDDFANEDGRVVLTESPVEVPANVAALLESHPAVAVVD